MVTGEKGGVPARPRPIGPVGADWGLPKLHTKLPPELGPKDTAIISANPSAPPHLFLTFTSDIHPFHGDLPDVGNLWQANC